MCSIIIAIGCAILEILMVAMLIIDIIQITREIHKIDQDMNFQLYQYYQRQKDKENNK